MIGKVIYIDDEEDSRVIYQDILEDVYGEECEVISIAPSNSIGKMIGKLGCFDDLVSVVIDEKLQVGASTDFQGSQLVEAIRAFDSKIPLYILTSEIGLLTPPLGSVEYIIDKNEIEKPVYKEQLSMLMRRHINSFNDIKTKRTARFDELLKKSVEEGLSSKEQKEYEDIDFVRVKYILSSEAPCNSEALDKQQELLDEIEGKLNELREG